MNMNSITIQKADLTRLAADAIVNAANEGLWEGGGVCGAIFRAAGSRKLTEACSAIGHCDTGSAVITPGFDLPAKYIIHAVGPRWHGGTDGEPEQLYGAYQSSLALAREHGLHSIGFPLISSGIFGYPKEDAWRTAIKACRDFFSTCPDANIAVTFCVLDDEMKRMGERVAGDY